MRRQKLPDMRMPKFCLIWLLEVGEFLQENRDLEEDLEFCLGVREVTENEDLDLLVHLILFEFAFFKAASEESILAA